MGEKNKSQKLVITTYTKMPQNLKVHAPAPAPAHLQLHMHTCT